MVARVVQKISCVKEWTPQYLEHCLHSHINQSSAYMSRDSMRTALVGRVQHGSNITFISVIGKYLFPHTAFTTAGLKNKLKYQSISMGVRISIKIHCYL